MPSFTKTVFHPPVFYVTRDIERAIGLENTVSGYTIISNFGLFRKQPEIPLPEHFLVQEDTPLDTHELLQHPKVLAFIRQKSNHEIPRIVVFKNTKIIEKICKDQGFILLNPNAALSQTVEEKISQVTWLQELTTFLPPHKIQTAQEGVFEGTPFILQFNRAHTGLGTHKITNQKQLQEIQNIFPNRPVRITKYLNGPMFTNNNVVTPKHILLGNINLQITGLSPFTQNPFATVGNDWGLPKKILTPKHLKTYHFMATQIGEKLRSQGWKGLFGIDVILDKESDELFLIEINARQPASTTYESQLQASKKTNEQQITTFEAHLLTLLDQDISDRQLISLSDGAQIVVRNTAQKNWSEHAEQLLEPIKNISPDITVSAYQNTTPGSDALRIQSPHSLLTDPHTPNPTGKQIQDLFV